MHENEHIEAVFHRALEMPPGEERRAWVEAECSGDEAARDEVLSLLESNAAMEEDQPGSRSSDGFQTGQRFGAYRVTGLLAHGGMSAVYRAERADGSFQQVVALKVMARWLASPEFLRKFDSERQFLASLEHPNITRLLDGGVSAEGDPFLITEFVDGLPLDGYCDEHKLRIEQRLRIFLQICGAVDYAHRNLIVHRDLKPANMLVNREGVAKLLDFGAASLTATPQMTQVRMVTPQYASPEQLRGDRAGVPSDIYSLGVILYELLTGAKPFATSESLVGELSRATGEARVTAPAAVTITVDAVHERSTSAQQLRSTLRGDLSEIVLKAMEHDPARRYGSVRQFSEDIEAFLANRPVLARPQTTLYRAGRFLRRHWLSVTVAAVFGAGLATAAAVAIHQARVARDEAARAERISKFTRDTFLSASPAVFSTLRNKTGAIQFSDILDNAVTRVDAELKNDPLAEADMRGTIASTYSVLGDFKKGEEQIRIAIAHLDKSGNMNSPRGANLYLWLCMAVSYQGFYKEALPACEKSVELSRAYGSESPLAGLLHDTAYMIYKSGGRFEDAEKMFREALAIPTSDPHLANLFPALINN
jgi:serine/threonine protein kinase